MEITGATYNFTKKVVSEGENAAPEKPKDESNEKQPKTAGESEKDKGKGNALSAFAYDMIKQGITQTISGVMANASASPTLQIQLQAAQQVGGKLISYTAAVASQNWAAVGAMAISDASAFVSKTVNFSKDKAWSDYDLEMYRERRGYSSSRNRH